MTFAMISRYFNLIEIESTAFTIILQFKYIFIVQIQFVNSLNKKRLMQFQKIKQAFEKRGLSQNTYIPKEEFFRFLNQLAPGGDFHEEVAEEIWNQAAANDRFANQLRVNDVCMTIVDAQNILKTRINQSEEQIQVLESQKRKLQANPSREALRKIQEIDFRLNQLYEQKQSFEEDYRLISQTFGIQLIGSVMNHQYQTPMSGEFGPPSNRHYESNNEPAERYEGHLKSEELTFLLYLTLAFGFIEVIIIYGKYDFLNLMVLTCLLSIYCLNFFDRIYIFFTLTLIVVSIILDFVWLIMQAGIKWNPPEIGNDSKYEVKYLRFIVFFTAVIMILKVGLGFYLFKYRNTDNEDKYMVSIGKFSIFLNANRSNPISKGIVTNFTAP